MLLLIKKRKEYTYLEHLGEYFRLRLTLKEQKRFIYRAFPSGYFMEHKKIENRSPGYLVFILRCFGDYDKCLEGIEYLYNFKYLCFFENCPKTLVLVKMFDRCN